MADLEQPARQMLGLDPSVAGDQRQAAPGVGASAVTLPQTDAQMRASEAVAAHLQRAIPKGVHTDGDKLAS